MASSVWKFGHSLDRVVAGVREGLSQLDGCELTAVSRTEARVRISATFTNDAGRVDDVSLDVEEKEGQTFITLFSKTRGKGEKSFYDQNRRNLYRVYAALPFTPVSSVPALPVTIPQEYELLVIAMLDPKSGVTLKDRKWMILKKYPHTFLGSEMVDWLMQHKNISREESIELASKLYKLGLFTYAEGKNKPFRDGKFYYRFMIGDDANWEELENLEQRMQAIERKATDEYNRLLFNAPHVPDPSAASQPSVIVPSSPRSAISSNQRSPSPPLGRRSSYPGKKEKQTKKKTANDLSSSEESDSHVSERRNSSSSKEVGANLGTTSIGESGSKQQKLLSLTKFTRKRDLTSSGVEYMQPPSVDGSPLTLQRKHLSDLKRDEKKKKGGLWASRNRIMTRKKSKKEKEKEKKLGSRASSASSGVVYVPAGEGKGLLVVGADHASEEVVWDDDPLTARKRLIKEEQKRIEMLKNMKKFWEMKLYGEVIGRKKAESIERTLQRSNTTLEEDSGLDGGKEASAPTGEEGEAREVQPTDKKRDKTGTTKHKRIRSKSKKDEKKSKPLSGSKTAEDKDQADTVCEVKKRARNLTIGSPTGSSSSFKKMLEDVSGSWSNDDGTTSWIKEQFENRRKAGGSVVLQTPDSTHITKTETEVLSSSSAAPSSSTSSSSSSSTPSSSSSPSSATVAPIKDPPPAIILSSEDDGSAPTRVRFDTASQKMAEKRWQDYLAAQDLKRSRATIQGFELLKGVKKLPVDKFAGEKGDSNVDESAEYDDDDDVLNVSIEEILYDCEKRKEVLEKAKELIQTNYELRLKIQENHLQSQMLFNHLNTSGATATATATATAIEKKPQKTEEMESQSPSSSSKESDETYKLLDQSDFDGDVASALASYGGGDSAILRLSEDSPQREENEEEDEEDDSDDEEEESSSSYYDEDEDDDDDDDEEDSGDSSDEEALPSATEYLLTSDSIIMRSEMTRQQSYASPSFIQPPSEIVRPVDKSSTKQEETSTSTQQKQNDEERKVNFLPKVLTEGEFAYCRNIDFTDVVLLEPPVGYGAFGVVYRGIWRGAIVAVKKLLVVLDNKQFLQFLREAEIMEHVSNHPNVAHFCGVTSTKPHYCIVGEFYEHGSMVDYLRNNPNAPLNVVVSMARDAAAGVLHLHKEDIIHRDLAARNLLVCSNLHVHVSDFGLARTKQRVNAQTNGNLGAVKWMAPEAITHRHFSEKSDSWSFGVVLWEMVTGGKEPYQDKEILDVALGVSSGALRLEIPEECPKPLRRLIKKCLQHDPQQRPSFEEIWGQLDEFLRFLEGTADSSSS